ncbi:hypothetical protein C0Q70_01571 [Pomacea canaliculata]|uniref:Uncharacterized protein n=1 Tax=Pomacea canaliculata TaxID=400727 RepID=A0A2T7PZU3_POMCA|nr:hypothetical protein C0Q70_01571 [Pomacea canaliculata]
MMVLMVLVLAAGDMVRQAEGAAVPGFQHVPAAAHLRDSGQKDDPLARLSKVFGISRIPARVVHRTPPQYMTELYQAVADTRSGLTKANGPYNANTIRSFPDRGEYLVLLLCRRSYMPTQVCRCVAGSWVKSFTRVGRRVTGTLAVDIYMPPSSRLPTDRRS